MHQQSHSELQGVSTLRGASTQRTTQDRASWSSKPRSRGRPRLCPQSGAPLWAWLLLAALVVPGAWSYLSEEEEELLVELHNHYRGQVSPSASAMLPLKWDPNLKLIAEGYAAKCIWSHNPLLGDTGENLYAGTGSLDLREAMEKWFLEHLDYDFTNNSCDESKMCGHYTQMVWADTHRVGCAFHLCNTMDGLGWEKVSFLVCNYYPAGNYEDVRPYVEGDSCSRCPENVQKCENNLCVAETVDDYDDEDIDEDDVVSLLPSTDFPTSQPAREEEEAAVPPLATSDPSIQPEEEEKEVVPPPAATTPASTPSTTITSILDAETPNTKSGTPPPGVPSTREEEEVKEEVKEEEVKEEVKEEEVKDEVVKEEVKEVVKEEVVEKRTEPPVKMEKGAAVTLYSGSAASGGSCALLLVCLTLIQTLRL